MQTYKIPIIWSVSDIVEVEAETLEEAIKKASDLNPTHTGVYVDDSFYVCEEEAQHLNDKT